MSYLMIAIYLAVVLLLGYVLVMLLRKNRSSEEILARINDAMLTQEELIKHAAFIARSHNSIRNVSGSRYVAARLKKNFKLITWVNRELTKDTNSMFPTVPAAEWLLDNYYIIEEQARDIGLTLSKGYLSELPVISKGNITGMPRSYALAADLVSHTDARVDERTVINFINSYQTQCQLSMRELWSVAIMLRIALIENIRSLCENILTSQEKWHIAEKVAEIIERNEKLSDAKIIEQLNELIKGKDESHPSFVQHLVQKVRRRGTKTTIVMSWLNAKLEAQNLSADTLAGIEHQVQAAMQVSIGNAISSLRAIANMDWNDIFESLSQVEHILRTDPSSVYKQMDFESRDYYRQRIEKIARRYGTSEILVAKKIIECSEAAKIKAEQDAEKNNAGQEGTNTVKERTNTVKEGTNREQEGTNTEQEVSSANKEKEAEVHVGYYLAGSGLNLLQKSIGKKVRPYYMLFELLRSHPFTSYFGIFAIISTLILIIFSGYAFARQETQNILIYIITIISLIIPVTELAITFLNNMISFSIVPSLLPKMELAEGIPETMATMVIIPTLLPNEKRVKELIEQMELLYLSNKTKNLYFALVGDFKDSPKEHMEEDTSIISAGLNGVKRLNKLYVRDESEHIFFFFNRVREYNVNQKRWMGWERKRGAIIQFNDLLRGQKTQTFGTISCNVDNLPWIKYVITLDADTNLPMGAAKRLIGTIAHPLNKARTNKAGTKVIRGYGILQPRVGISIISANKTMFTRIFAGQAGIDPYAVAVSDVYQDLFGEGIFTGKGIYDIDVFRKILNVAIPENTVLSHDLLEGSYIRTGLVSDIELIDGYPARYNAYIMRLHRWVRGDWQLLPWLLHRVLDKSGNKVNNPINSLSKWKILDNLRRSLVNPSVLILTLFGFTILPGTWVVWLSLAAITAATPLFSYVLGVILSENKRTGRERTYSTLVSGAKGAFYQACLLFAFIPYQAYMMLDAIIRTLARVIFTKRNLLEWVTAADMEANLKNNFLSFIKRMWFSCIAGVLTAISGIYCSAIAGIFGSVIGIVWIIAPYIAYHISKPVDTKIINISEEDNKYLRHLARKTWRYFDDLASIHENYLPPDNYQEEPAKGSAHRTSPTNIGLMLLSILSARDFGFITMGEMLNMIDNTLCTVEKMRKWKGHLYNWYNTITLEVLRPRYVSTVDSGNFLGYLMVLVEGLKEYDKKPLLDVNLAKGLKDTVILFNIEIQEYQKAIDLSGIEGLVMKLNTEGGNEREIEGENDLSLWNDVVENTEEQLDAILNEIPQKFYWGVAVKNMIKDLKAELYCCIGNDKPNEYYEITQKLIIRLQKLIDAMEFKPLYDPKMQLFSIGYNVEDGHLTKSYYDLLASEARQASYIAIARGEIDRKHWFRLGRKLAKVDGYKGLVSWTGTMFEYLMPQLIMKNFDNTLLAETYHFVLQNQKLIGQTKDIPWGISESGYNVFDINLNYQYKAFGVPELGLKRGLENDLVVAPYATFLALPFDSDAAIKNLRKFKDEAAEGAYGFYEALDYTTSRLRKGEKKGIVKSYMVHHQGMSLAAINNFLNAQILQKRFHNIPIIKAAELLLQERVPQKVVFHKEHKQAENVIKKASYDSTVLVRTIDNPCPSLPYVHVLSNGEFSSMITDKGTGYSRVNGMAINRWAPSTGGINGTLIFLQNINSNIAWSATYEPNLCEPEEYKVVFSPDKAEFMRKDGNIETHTQITVASDDQAEIRRISITNNSNHTRVIEVTSYFEIVLAQPDEDLAHPAFSNLFVKTEYLPQYNSLMASRRPRSENKKITYGIHCVACDCTAVGEVQYETDKFKFIGRNRNITNPIAMLPDVPLTNTVGAVLDPIMSIRIRIKIEAGQSGNVAFTSGSAETRKNAYALAAKYNMYDNVERAFELAWTRSQIEAEYFGFSCKETEQFLRLLRAILFVSPLRRLMADMMKENSKGQPGLWSYGISGDLPIMLVKIRDREDLELVTWSLRAHEYWRIKGVKTDLVLLLEDENSYIQPLFDMVGDLVLASHEHEVQDSYGGVFIRNASIMPTDDILLLHTASAIVIKDSPEVSCSLLEECIRYDVPKRFELQGENSERKKSYYRPRGVVKKELNYFNGIGGFSKSGDRYIMQLRDGQHTPLPWSNIISNSNFGFQVSESSLGFIWAENSRENKLTPWSNDPVGDYPSEVIYVRDEENGRFWSVTPMPIRNNQDYVITHGHGYSVYEHESNGVNQRLTVFAASKNSVKISILKLINRADSDRNLSITYYARPVMGVSDKKTASFIVSEYDEDSKVLLFKNSYNSLFPGRVMFMDCSEEETAYTANEAEFIGYGGSMERPAALNMESLSNTTGAGFDPCAAIQVKINLRAGVKKKIVLLLGQGKDKQEAIELALKYKDTKAAINEYVKVKKMWAGILEKIQVNTPDDSMDIMLNGWLLYQVLSCRIWARSAFYQCGGAYGFRDQLQDAMALIHAKPEIVRNQILLHASRQFIEGDVQHWWHKEEGKGIRTRYSDDLLWLPYVTADYIENTGDYSILNELVGYLQSPVLVEGEDERYEFPVISDQKSDIYEHCIKAIEKSLRFGKNGIPLMGSGDWNDGMNTVGNKGKGESVWLGWFLYSVLDKFKEICKHREDMTRYEKYLEIMTKISDSIESNAWDGSWYRRAYFDDGTPLGSTHNTECRIDSISQSWAAISGAGRPNRVKESMFAVENYLIDKNEGIIKLLTPPFDSSELEPGYIKGYVPGVRENGGQYTHAAVWVVMAFAKMGMGDKAWEMFHLINPVNHSRTQIEYSRYKTEPYVMSADVYAIHPHEGRGGWSWYTGAAGWMYRVGTEHILGVKRRADHLIIDPCIPTYWDVFSMKYTYKSSLYCIKVKNERGVSKGVKQVEIDGVVVDVFAGIELVDDGGIHHVLVEMG